MWARVNFRVAAVLLGAGFVGYPISSAAGWNASSISLAYFIMRTPAPDSGPCRVRLEERLSGAPFLQYDSLSSKARPRGAWAKTFEDWDVRTESLLQELQFDEGLIGARSCWASSAGSLIWQEIIGCELSRDGHTEYHWHYACDGNESLTFNLTDLTWTAAGSAAEDIKMSWEAKPSIAETIKHFLVNTCTAQLGRYWSYANVTEQPVGKISRNVNESVETLVCHVYGFYPREINAIWKLNGTDQKDYTFYQVAPNADGTFYLRLSIDIDPQKRDQYQCHVNHTGHPGTLVLAWEEPPATNTWVVVGLPIIFITITITIIIIITISSPSAFCCKSVRTRGVHQLCCAFPTQRARTCLRICAEKILGWRSKTTTGPTTQEADRLSPPAGPPAATGQPPEWEGLPGVLP